MQFRFGGEARVSFFRGDAGHMNSAKLALLRPWGTLCPPLPGPARARSGWPQGKEREGSGRGEERGARRTPPMEADSLLQVTGSYSNSIS